MSGAISAPERLAAHHELELFHCSEESLDEWLKLRALENEAKGASRTYVVCVDRRVVGFYAIAAGGIAHSVASGKIRRNMPDPIPAMILGRLAVDLDFQGRRIGSDLLIDAIARTAKTAEITGIRAILVPAISDRARQFYEAYGFRSSPVNPLTLMITIAEAIRYLPSS